MTRAADAAPREASFATLEEWQRAQVAQDHLTARLDAALLASQELSARELILLRVLATQDDEEGGHYRMKELAGLVGLSPSATTRLVGRLEDRGLLVRYICPTDRRGIYTNVTTAGTQVLDQAEDVAGQILAAGATS